MSRWPNASNSSRAEYLSKQGLSVGSIRRMVTWEYGYAPCNRQLENLVEMESERRARMKRRYLSCAK